MPRRQQTRRRGVTDTIDDSTSTPTRRRSSRRGDDVVAASAIVAALVLLIILLREFGFWPLLCVVWLGFWRLLWVVLPSFWLLLGVAWIVMTMFGLIGLGDNAPPMRGVNKGTGSPILTGALANLGGPKEYSYGELSSATNSFASDQELGQGASGIVYKGHIGEDGTPVAVKKITSGARQGITEYKSEVESLSQLRHRNLVRLLGYCHEVNEFVLVYEFVGGGSLYYHLFERKPPLTWTRRYNISRGLASALYYLQNQCRQCVMHRDIKSSNVMLDETFEAKLGDFGLARLVDHTRDAITTKGKGTPGYWAPELFRIGKATKECDVYSFGVVLLEIGSGKKAIFGREPQNLVEWVWRQYGPQNLLGAVDKKLGKNFDKKQAKALMILGLSCAHPIASSRPSIEEVVSVLNSKAKPPKLPPKMPSFNV